MSEEVILTDNKNFAIRMDELGFPVMLADVAPAGVSKVDADAESGNPRHDIRSGKFAKGGRPGDQPPPPNTDPVEFKRMIDAVRDAAREFDVPDAGNIREFLAGRARAPDQVDIQKFLLLVQEQRKSDAVDIFDQQIRSPGILAQGKRVRLAAPKGFVKSLIGSLDGDALGEVMHRLEAKGHDRKDIDKFFKSKAGRDAQAAAQAKRDSFESSEESWTVDPRITVELGSDHGGDDSVPVMLAPGSLNELADRIVAKLQADGKIPLEETEKES